MVAKGQIRAIDQVLVRACLGYLFEYRYSSFILVDFTDVKIEISTLLWHVSPVFEANHVIVIYEQNGIIGLM